MTITLTGIEYFPFLILLIAALWKENAVLFMLVSGVSLITGLYSPDILSTIKNVGFAAGLMLIAFSFLSAGWSLRLMFWSDN